MRLDGKVCLVTGGASGIGRATCELFAREGAVLAIADKNGEAAAQTADRCGALGAQAFSIEVDVGDAAGVRRMIDETVARYDRLDVLVNNAGYGIPGSVVETGEDDWNALMAVNVNGVFLACKHAIPLMAKRGGGVIVNVASVVASVGIRNRAAYCASKGAVAALTRAMALDHVDDGIRINAVAPGTIESPYFDAILSSSRDTEATRRGLRERQAMRRMGRPEEVALGIAYLASDESSFCTGTILTIDGGMTAQ
ncbi:SDR family oxidoreductase [Marinivivus vitaminiproducens]|uniref:SDR family oxidoreductase n=1 Tax=Marinivivus vitaminiproducens TaxID=3035935 RepID=UPI00279EB45E|nr:SDR family oxidoreductase [Geminicoccaceae bacterium SCSIO 64248]